MKTLYETKTAMLWVTNTGTITDREKVAIYKMGFNIIRK